jgi:tetratricopeptide (TPR) repeat protein
MRYDPFDIKLKERHRTMLLQANDLIQKRLFHNALRIVDDILRDVSNLALRPDWLYKTFYDPVEFMTASIRWHSGQLSWDKTRYKQLHWLELPISEAYLARAFIRIEENRIPEAIQDLETAIEWNPIHGEYYFELGYIYNWLLKDHQRSLELCIQGLQNTYQKTSLARGYRSVGAALIDLRDLDTAEAAYLKSLHLEPTNRLAKMQLVYISTLKPATSIDGSLESCNRVLMSKGIPTSIHPSFAEAFSGLGQACMQQKLFQQAVDYYKRAVEINPKLSSAHAGLALAYTELKEFDLAKKHRDIALEIEGKT